MIAPKPQVPPPPPPTAAASGVGRPPSMSSSYSTTSEQQTTTSVSQTQSSSVPMSQSAHDIVAAALSGGSAFAGPGSSPGLANLPNSSVDGHEESPEKLSLKARLKLFEKEIEQQGAAPAPKPEKKFSFLNDFELAKMKEEEERRIANMTRAEFAKLTSSSPNCSALIDEQESRLAEEETDKALDDVDDLDRMARGHPSSSAAAASAGAAAAASRK